MQAPNTAYYHHYNQDYDLNHDQYYNYGAWQNKSYGPNSYASPNIEEYIPMEQYQQGLIGNQASRATAPSKFKIFCRTFGLLLFYNLFQRIRGRPSSEEPKIAMYKDRWVAFFRGLLHFIPVSGALTIVVVNCIGYYIGGELAGASGETANSQKLAALQFAAKLHELFMLASIATIVFGYVRRELTAGDGIPFGAVFGGLQFNSISFLWSPEMWGVIMNKWNAKRKKNILIMLLVLATVLGVTVGPSTAVLMRPRLSYWPAGGTSFWLDGTMDDFTPMMIEDDASLVNCTQDTGNSICPHHGWRLISEQYLEAWSTVDVRAGMPGVYSLYGYISRIVVQTSSTAGRQFYNARTMAMVAPFVLAERIADLSSLWAAAAAVIHEHDSGQTGRYTYRLDNQFQIRNAWQPGVQALCRLSIISSNDSMSMSFPNMSSYVVTGPGDVVGRQNYTNVDYSDAKALQQYLDLYNTHRHGVVWLDDLDLLGATNSSLNAIVGAAYDGGRTWMHFCSIDARWITTTLTSTRSGGAETVAAQPPYNWHTEGLRMPGNPQMTISAAWAKYLNPIDAAHPTDPDVISSLIDWHFFAGVEVDVIESILVNLVVNGLARVGQTRNMIGQFRDFDSDDPPRKNSWIGCMLPHVPKWCDQDSAFNVSAADIAHASRMEYTVLDQGYAYSSKGFAAVAGLMVLITYSVFALSHWMYMLWTGWTSSAWDTPAEIVTLAVQSESTGKLNNTGAGIETTEIFEERVKIKVKDGKLEYVFNDTVTGGDSVVKDHRYS